LGVTLKVINDKSFAIQSFLESVTVFKGNGMLPLMVMEFYWLQPPIAISAGLS